MISEIIEKWIKGILIDGITGNLSGLFDNVNAKVGEIASDVGSTPQAWNSGIFNMLRSLSEAILPTLAFTLSNRPERLPVMPSIKMPFIHFSMISLIKQRYLLSRALPCERESAE